MIILGSLLLSTLISKLTKVYGMSRSLRPYPIRAPGAQAVAYGSRRDDAGRCLMLFGQRMPDPPLIVVSDEPLALEPRRSEIIALIRRLKIHKI